MPAYHSSFNEEPDVRFVGNLSLLPFKSKIRGPAPIADPASLDIIDETLDLFRANSLFRNFEIKGPADRLLIILILFISDCLSKIASSPKVPTQIEATKLLNTLAVDNFPIPGDANFQLNAHYATPSNRTEADSLRQYLVQARQETAGRLVEKLYADGTGKPSKWWMCFTKRRFMNRSLGN
ncbi:subunit of the Arp2/3 complex [Serendipita sp. 396]|nr:subunit of the Arp2/3 complex [Serendipita sp. 396]KAG8799731.1 subunit of the Arp2/3 complex [Serendipita sp. 398]KAG8828561.1 subunit of the Arp2/3 complex [Serendipita sp. 401]KAG8850975.1 subunit of the Arp2/3 complex [Serendipita sp. 411]KAG8867791.1 subunit of the Arp2/3 complex [Serendipita sp. 405]KAG9058567.1 subunit of the Arp2/3 complex [Serendipita sp. 407]